VSDGTSAAGPRRGQHLEEATTLPRGPESSGEQGVVEEAVHAPVPASVTGGEQTMTRASELSLRRQDAARARGFARVVVLLCGGGLVVQQWLGGVSWLRALFAAALVVLGGTALWAWRRAMEPMAYGHRVARIFGCAAGATAVIAGWYLGVLSPAPMLGVLGVAFFAMSDDRIVAFAVPFGTAAAYVLLASLVSADVLPDVGLMHALSVDVPARVAAVVSVPGVIALAVWQARVTRRATLDAIERATAALREVRTREAQLEEANRDLDVVLRRAEGRDGPYTGLTAGRYLIGHLIARGAMGEVYAATHDETRKEAAIKLLQPSMLGDDQLVARFLRESEAASRLEDDHIVEIFEVGQLGANGAPYIAMELLRGHDLAWHLRQRGELPVDEVIALVDQVARALEAARRAGIVHRDLKPQNLFLAQQDTAAPVWKILDFGVSRLLGTGGTLTMDMIVGTPAYMAPEQAAGGEATHRSDVFSLGAVAYRALTGQPPFLGPDTPQILYQVVYQNPVRPSSLMPGLPADVEMVLAIALAKDAGERFGAAVEMAAAMAAAAKGRLDPSLRLQAQTLLAALPWGACSRDASVVPPVAIEP
jgi:tRNA A-37 threonylcarbamoyl transferase component Bud32